MKYGVKKYSKTMRKPWAPRQQDGEAAGEAVEKIRTNVDSNYIVPEDVAGLLMWWIVGRSLGEGFFQ